MLDGLGIGQGVSNNQVGMDLKRQIGEDELRAHEVQNSLVLEPTGNHELGVEGTITNKEVDGFRSNGLHDEELVLGCKSPLLSTLLAEEGG
ncbi:hypothetical protein V6N13_065152 [Hibiscus sabdariffa]|uniref:Uncharacterized protein n=1 Tax=Hibiscus sabdariffa TaxID=183260 RepID=A0ABR2QRN3_9ROSI